MRFNENIRLDSADADTGTAEIGQHLLAELFVIAAKQRSVRQVKSKTVLFVKILLHPAHHEFRRFLHRLVHDKIHDRRLFQLVDDTRIFQCSHHQLRRWLDHDHPFQLRQVFARPHDRVAHAKAIQHQNLGRR